MVGFFIEELLSSDRPFFLKFVSEYILSLSLCLFWFLLIFGFFIIFCIDNIEIVFACIDYIRFIVIFLCTFLIEVACLK